MHGMNGVQPMRRCIKVIGPPMATLRKLSKVEETIREEGSQGPPEELSFRSSVTMLLAKTAFNERLRRKGHGSGIANERGKKNRGKASHRVAHHDRFPRRIAIDDLSQMLTRALNVFGNAGETGVILRLLKIFHKDSIGLETFS